MSARARHKAKHIWRQKRLLQRLERQVRPLTAGELTVIQHLIQPVINGRHFSAQVCTYQVGPIIVDSYGGLRRATCSHASVL
jgi:hypothetical protein